MASPHCINNAILVENGVVRHIANARRDKTMGFVKRLRTLRGVVTHSYTKLSMVSPVLFFLLFLGGGLGVLCSFGRFGVFFLSPCWGRSLGGGRESVAVSTPLLVCISACLIRG